ncbi:MAG: thioredoxin-like domain-containing protein [Crocinitomicaceae bacterium]
MSLKPFLLSLLILIGSAHSFAQELKFKVVGLKDTTVHLVKYAGKGMYYSDTAQSVNGVVKFDGKKQLEGVYALFLPGQRYFDFIYDLKPVEIEVSDIKDLVGSLKVKKSKTNIAFYEYINFMTTEKTKAAGLNTELKSADEERKTAIKAELVSINENVVEFQKKLVEDHKTEFLGDLINMSIDVKLPSAPKDKNGVITDSSFVYQYYINHFWDNTNLQNDAILRTPLFHKKLETYLSKEVLVQVPDTISLYADKLISKTHDTSYLFQYIVAHITSKAEQSQMMGMENVFVHMIDKYYGATPTRTPWMSEENLKKVIDRSAEIRPTMIGATAPRLCLPDSTEKNWVDLYKIDAEYKIVYFWEPTCGHCKKSTPKLQTLYDKKFKERNIEIYAVGKAMASDFELWKKFISDNGLTFTNVGMTKSVYEEAQENAYFIIKDHNTTLESLNYTKTYDVASTPRIFVLDKDNKILFKRISIAQLEQILDNLQGFSNAEKIFPIEEEDPEDRKRANE